MKKALLTILGLLFVVLQGWADTPFRQHRYSSFTALDVNENSIVFIGNSITNMHEWWEAFGCNQNILNRGNSGAISDETLENLESIIAGHPRKVFLMIGTNDLGTSGINTPAHVATNVRQIAKRFHEESPQTEVYLQSILPSSVGLRTLEAQQQANDSIRKICGEFGATYIDLWDVLGDYSNWSSDGISNDALHLSPKGFYRWCNKIAPYVGSDCVYTNGPNQYGGLSQSYAMRISAFGDLPVRSDDVLFIGDEVIHGGEWHEIFHCDKIKDRGNCWGYGGRPISTTLISIPIILQGRSGNEAPAKVFLYAGVADVNSSSDINATFTEYKKIVDKIRELAPNTPIYLMAHLPQNNATTNTNKVVPFNILQQQLAEDMANVTYIDTYTPFAKNGVCNDDYMASNYLMGRGYNRMARLLANYLQEEGVSVLSEEESDNLMAVYAQRNALGKVISSAGNLQKGSGVGQYPEEAYSAVENNLAAAYNLLKNDASVSEMQSMATTLTQDYQTLLQSINLPQTSTDGDEHWYTLCATLRGSRYIQLSQAAGGLEGSESLDGSNAMWKFVKRSDGKGWDIVNRKYGSYMSPTASNNTQVSTVATQPAKGWTLSYASTAGMFIISSDKVQLNQTNSPQNYQIYNWSSGYTGTDRTDTGCQFTIAEVDYTTLYPIDDYEEPRVGTTPDASEWNALGSGLQATWASRDVHYSLHRVPEVTQTTSRTLYAWKGERANIQALLYSKTDQGNLTVRMTEWTRNGTKTGINAGDARFVNYVITDDYKACGNHPSGLTTWLVPDVIDQDKAHAVPAMETRPVWCTLEIPRDAEAGEYQTTLQVLNESSTVLKTLTLKVVVNSHALPTVANQKFHLDFWQQPYSVSRYYGVERWSDEHIEALRPYLQALGRAGQRTVSAIMFYEPWGEQTHDLFDPMVQTTKKSDGTWTYDYTIFDKYVTLCDECGINKQINCFSMVPWDMSFRYWDEASNSYQSLTTTTTTDEYKALWTSFLTAFKAHLQEKGWFDKTNIAMDERSESDMLNAYNIANALGFNMALAGNYHSSLTGKLKDFCVALGQDKNFTAAQRATRKANNWVTTFYTSCAEAEPNIFSNSLPAEATFLPLYAAANELDGYLHWAWINWDEHPLTDSRFRKFGAGDTYCYYPGNRSSVRFERLIEGIHQYEKVMILKEEYKNDAARLDTLNTLLQRFVGHAVTGDECAAKVNDLEAYLNGQKVELPRVKTVGNGYYHMVSKATSRTEHLYNNALLSGNTRQFTLQSNTQVTTNNGIWRIEMKEGDKLGICNGDGHPMVAGVSWGGSVAGTFNELTISETMDVDDYRYYYFTEAINCTNGGNNFKVNGTDFITTWAAGPSTADDQLWRFEPVDTEGKFIYNVSIEGNADAYVIYTHGTIQEKAFNGGFFIADSEITKQNLSYGTLGTVIGHADVSVQNGAITLSNIKTLEEPDRTDLYNTSNGDGVVPPYRIPGIATASNGRLITVAARLVCGTDPGYGQVDVVCRTSDDNGLTWTDKKEVAVGTGITSATENFFDTAFGDPAVVADRTSNEILVMAVAGCTVWSNGNTTRQNPNLIATIYSKDNGDTWESPIDVTEPIYSLFDSGNPMQAAFVGGGKIFQSRIVKKDKYYRLYAALNARPNGNRVIYSDDFGRTWKALGGASALPAPGGDEPKCEEMPDGRVILTSRVSGGRIFNIYTYENTLSGTGSWGSPSKCTFAGSGLTPGANSTNGEMLVIPVTRNSDQKEMYLALQSMPTGSSRTNVGIYYKELTDLTDLNTVGNFAIDWNGFHQVSTTHSAYSSLDLQADGKVGFIYEETLTSFGKRANPVSTSFPTGAGEHNFDGFDNIYLAMEVEYLTNGAYSLKRDVSRKGFLKTYFEGLADASSLTAATKNKVKTAAANLSEQPTTAEVDAIYALMNSEVPADPWDGRVVTFTNVQKSGTEYALYVNESNVLKTSTSSAADLGEKAEFTCKKVGEKYTFFNEASQQYLIWRASDSQGYGYNSNKGTLATYNSTYCDWTVSDGSGTKADTYYLTSKRSDGSKNGVLIVMKSGVFDAWSSGVAWTDNYSNLFRIDVKPIPGDVNEDGIVSIADVTALVSMILGKQSPTAHSDVNGDTAVSIADVTAVVRLILEQ